MDLLSYMMGRNSAGGGGGNSGGSGGGVEGKNIVHYKYGMPTNDVGFVKVSDLLPTADELYNGLLIVSAPRIEGEYDQETYSSRLCRMGRDYVPAVEDTGCILIGKDILDEDSSSYLVFLVVVDEELVATAMGLPLERGIYFPESMSTLDLREGYEAYLVWDK